MRRLLREPLVHFLLLGAAIFALYALVSGRRGAPREDRIVVSSGRIEHLAAVFTRTWQRPPTRRELDGLIDDYVREEAAFREGTALGLDADDAIIRSRIHQKVDFIAENAADRVEPTEADLEPYFRANLDALRHEPLLSFHQVYLDPQRRGEDLEADARALLGALDGRPSMDASALGDPVLLERAYENVTLQEVAGLFGADFAAAIEQLEPGAWHGPVRSGYGVHLVRIDRREAARVPEPSEVRAEVVRAWENDQRHEAVERFYRDLLDGYEVVIEWPKAGGRTAGEP